MKTWPVRGRTCSAGKSIWLRTRGPEVRILPGAPKQPNIAPEQGLDALGSDSRSCCHCLRTLRTGEIIRLEGRSYCSARCSSSILSEARRTIAPFETDASDHRRAERVIRELRSVQDICDRIAKGGKHAS